MTREEQIMEYANSFEGKGVESDELKEIIRLAIIDGAKWADAHPKEPSLPSDLDGAAEISDLEAKNLANDYTKFLAAGLTKNEPRPIGPQWMKILASDRFKAGAEWMAGQGWKEVSATDYPKPDRDKIYCVYTQKDYPHYLLAKVINHPDDDELLQWKCTQYPFTRYDMCEGDSYLEIRKKQ